MALQLLGLRLQSREDTDTSEIGRSCKYSNRHLLAWALRSNRISGKRSRHMNRVTAEPFFVDHTQIKLVSLDYVVTRKVYALKMSPKAFQIVALCILVTPCSIFVIITHNFSSAIVTAIPAIRPLTGPIPEASRTYHPDS